jgi:hypothetical protein
VLRHVNEDHAVPELQFLERLHRLVVAAEANRELRLRRRLWHGQWFSSARRVAILAK